MPRKPITGLVVCCARPPDDHATAEPTMALKKSRRRMRPPENTARNVPKAYHFASCAKRKIARLMSALGQKRTYAPQQAVSALDPIATMKADKSESRDRKSVV